MNVGDGSVTFACLGVRQTM